jgi:hypothetical protein
MTDETINKETVEGSPGAAEKPNQQPSETQAAPSAVDEESLKGILEPLVQAEVDKRTQSIKDKRIAKQESRISGLEETLAQLKELKDEGLSEKFAIQFLEMREQLGSRGEVPPEVPPAEGQATPKPVAPDAILSSVLSIAGLDSGDPDVVEIMRSNPNDAASQVLAVNKLVESRKQAQQTPANEAAVMPSGGGSAVEPTTLESITRELNEELAKPSTPETRKRIQELGKQQREFIPKQ